MDSNTLKVQWTNIKRYKSYYIYIFIIHFLFAIYNTKSGIIHNSIEYFNYKLILQQVYLIFSIIFTVLLLINSSFLKNFSDYMRLYIKDIKAYFFNTFIVLSLINIIPFIIGSSLSFFINQLYGGVAPPKAFLVNLIIVSLEIISAILIGMSIVLLVKKTILVYLIYIIVIVGLTFADNIYISPVIFSSLLAKGDYYTTFSFPLWLGRFIVLSLGIVTYKVSLNIFMKKMKIK